MVPVTPGTSATVVADGASKSSAANIVSLLLLVGRLQLSPS